MFRTFQRQENKGGEHLRGSRWPTVRKTHFCASPTELSHSARGTDTLKSSSTGFKLSSAPSHKDYLLCFTTGATSGGRKKTSWLQKEREGWIKLDPPVPKELTREQPDGLQQKRQWESTCRQRWKSTMETQLKVGGADAHVRSPKRCVRVSFKTPPIMPLSYSTTESLRFLKCKLKPQTKTNPKTTPCCSYDAVRMVWCIHLQTAIPSHHQLHSHGARSVTLRLWLPLEFFCFFVVFFGPAALPWSCLTAAAQQVIRSPRQSGCAVRRSLFVPAANVRLRSVSTAPFALLFNVHIKGVKKSTRSASYRKSIHALHHSLTAASFTSQTQEFIPRELAHGIRVNSLAGNKHHFSPACATQRIGSSSPQQRWRQQREQQLLSPPLTSSSMSPCRRDAILGSCAAAQTAVGACGPCLSLCTPID